MNMTDDLESVDSHSGPQDTKLSDKSKRGRLKDVLDRTRHKITEKVREEKEARKWTIHSEKDQIAPSDTTIDDFLAAGRIKTGSSEHFSTHNIISPQADIVHHGASTPPRPSTSDSNKQFSPRRVPVPRIDVSASRRFPDAKEIGHTEAAELPGSHVSGNATHNQASLLQPEYNSRNPSTSSFASASRKARIRGLSVGFVDTPPIVIGLGGDEADAPPVEISRAWLRRAHSASPRGRMRQPANLSEPRRISDVVNRLYNPVDSPNTRSGQAEPSTNVKSPTIPDAAYNNSMIPLVRRTQTGLTDFGNSPITQAAPHLPPRNSLFLPPDSGNSQTVSPNRSRDTELSLGLKPSSPITGDQDTHESRIYAPKPQRAPPSYDLIEKGRDDEGSQNSTQSPLQNIPLRNTSAQSPQQMTLQQARSLERAPQRMSQHVSPQGHCEETTHKIRTLLPQQMLRHSLPEQTSHGEPKPIPPQALPEVQQTHQNVARNQTQKALTQDSFASTGKVHEVTMPLQDQPIASIDHSSGSTEHTVNSIEASQHVFKRPLQPGVIEGQYASDRGRHQLPERDIGQYLEMSADQTSFSRPSHERQRDQEMYPEFETFLRAGQLQDAESPPRYNISRFASLHAPPTRKRQDSPRQHSLPEHNHHSELGAKVLSPLDTSITQTMPRPTREQDRQSPRHSPGPNNLTGSLATVPPQVHTLRRVSPLRDYESSPSNYGSAVTSPQSGNGSATTKTRFYENANQGNPPTGFI